MGTRGKRLAESRFIIWNGRGRGPDFAECLVYGRWRSSSRRKNNCTSSAPAQASVARASLVRRVASLRDGLAASSPRAT